MEVDDMYTENEQEEAELEENVSTDIIFQIFAIVEKSQIYNIFFLL